MQQPKRQMSQDAGKVRKYNVWCQTFLAASSGIKCDLLLTTANMIDGSHKTKWTACPVS
jgi:hypothetical protein